MRILAFILLLAAPLAATPWDRDRPGDLHVSLPADACAGNFDRLPAQYYKMRSDRLHVQLVAAKFTDDVSLSRADDVTVALLRLGNLAPALQWIDRKQAALDKLKQRDIGLANMHQERLLKNKAMCLLARWRQARDLRDIDEALILLHRAADLGRLNPENGLLIREFEYWRKAVPPTDAVFPNILGLNELQLRNGGRQGALFAARLDGTIPHLLRRVTYGGEYGSPDIFYALSLALTMEGRHDDAALAWARLCEIIDLGARLNVTHNLGNEALKRALAWHLKSSPADAAARLAALRTAAAPRLEARAVQIEQALQRGEHPDIMDTFWTRWIDKPSPEPGQAAAAPGDTGPDQRPLVGTALWIGGGAAVLFLFLVVGGMAIFFARRHPPSPKVDEL